MGATALGRYVRSILQGEHAVLYVANAFRNLVADPQDALENLHEIEAASHLQVTGIVNNSHLKALTDSEAIARGTEYAQALAGLAGLPMVCTTVPSQLGTPGAGDVYPVESHVKNPWE